MRGVVNRVALGVKGAGHSRLCDALEECVVAGVVGRL